MSMGGKRKEVLKANVKAEELAYFCEGDGSVLCAFRGKARDWRGCLLQLPKEGSSAAAHIALRAKVQRTLADHCFETRFVDQQQLLLLPSAAVRAVDAQILSARPQEQRKVKLALQEHAEYAGHVPALRLQNVMEAPPVPGSSPLLAVELPLGCGLQELPGLPSRHSMIWHFTREGSDSAASHEPAALFAGGKEKLREAIQSALLPPFHGGSSRVFVDGTPVHPASPPVEQGWNATKKTLGTGDVLAGRLEGCCLKSSEELISALLAVLGTAQKGHGFLVDLLRLQCFAAGESEKLAPRLLQDLLALGGQEAVDELGHEEQILAAIVNASHGRASKEGMAAQEREGRRLLASGAKKPQDVAALQRWLGLFLLGRAAMEARVVISFFSTGAGSQSTPSEQRFLQSQRFFSLSELQPGQPDVWCCVTISGLLPRPPAEIAACATELEDLARRYKEAAATPGK